MCDSVFVSYYIVHCFVSFLVLQSSWRGNESWLLYFVWLPGALWLLLFCGSISRYRGLVCSVWLCFFLITLIYFLCKCLILVSVQIPLSLEHLGGSVISDCGISWLHLRSFETTFETKGLTWAFMFYWNSCPVFILVCFIFCKRNDLTTCHL